MTDVRRRHTLAVLRGAATAAAAGPMAWHALAAPPTAPVPPVLPSPAAGDERTLHAWRPARAPVLAATDLITGQPRTLADFAGGPLLVNFWASWCGPCRVEMPGLNALAERLAPSGLRFVAVNHGEMPERVRRFLAEVPLQATVVLDRSQTLLPAWGSGNALPATFLFDGKGQPRLWAQGERDWTDADLVRAVQALR